MVQCMLARWIKGLRSWIGWGDQVVCETGGWVTTSPAINTEDTIMVTGIDAKLYAIHALGNSIWTFALPGEGVMTAPAVNG